MRPTPDEYDKMRAILEEESSVAQEAMFNRICERFAEELPRFTTHEPHNPHPFATRVGPKPLEKYKLDPTTSQWVYVLPLVTIELKHSEE